MNFEYKNENSDLIHKQISEYDFLTINELIEEFNQYYIELVHGNSILNSLKKIILFLKRIKDSNYINISNILIQENIFEKIIDIFHESIHYEDQLKLILYIINFIIKYTSKEIKISNNFFNIIINLFFFKNFEIFLLISDLLNLLLLNKLNGNYYLNLLFENYNLIDMFSKKFDGLSSNPICESFFNLLYSTILVTFTYNFEKLKEFEFIFEKILKSLSYFGIKRLE